MTINPNEFAGKSIWARIEAPESSTGSGYTWRPAFPVAGGMWDFGPGGGGRAYHVNPGPVPVGTIVRLWPSACGDWHFSYGQG